MQPRSVSSRTGPASDPRRTGGFCGAFVDAGPVREGRCAYRALRSESSTPCGSEVRHSGQRRIEMGRHDAGAAGTRRVARAKHGLTCEKAELLHAPSLAARSGIGFRRLRVVAATVTCPARRPVRERRARHSFHRCAQQEARSSTTGPASATRADCRRAPSRHGRASR